MSRINQIPRTDIISLTSILTLSSHLRLGHPKSLFPVGLRVKILKAVLPSSILATCPAIVMFQLTILTILGLSKNLKIKIYKTIILPVVLYGCETWSLTLREEFGLRVFENRILRRIFGPKKDENGEWRRLRNEELLSLYSSHNVVRVIKSRRLRWADHVARMEHVEVSSKLYQVNLQEIDH